MTYPTTIAPPIQDMATQPYPSVLMHPSLLMATGRSSPIFNMPSGAYSLPSNIEQRPEHPHAADSSISMQNQDLLGAYMQPHMPLSSMGSPLAGNPRTSMMGFMPAFSYGPQSGIGMRRPAPDDNGESQSRSRRHRSH